MTDTEQALRLIEYFEWGAREYPAEKDWQTGIKISQQWLELVQASSISSEEVNSLFALVDLHKHEGAGWLDLALCIRAWLIQNKYPLQYPQWPFETAGSLE